MPAEARGGLGKGRVGIRVGQAADQMGAGERHGAGPSVGRWSRAEWKQWGRVVARGRRCAAQLQTSRRSPRNPSKSRMFLVTRNRPLTYAMAAICPSTNGGVLPKSVNRARSQRVPVRGFPVVVEDRESSPERRCRYSARSLSRRRDGGRRAQPKRSSCQTGAPIAASSSISRQTADHALASAPAAAVRTRRPYPASTARLTPARRGPGSCPVRPPNSSSGSRSSSARSVVSRKSRYAAAKPRLLRGELLGTAGGPTSTATGSPRRVSSTVLPFSASRISRGRLRRASAMEYFSVTSTSVMYILMYFTSAKKVAQP